MTLRQHRQRLHLSIDELSRRTGIERSRISRSERGYVVLRQDELQILATHVGVPVTELTVYAPA